MPTQPQERSEALAGNDIPHYVLSRPSGILPLLGII
jgi:hypothetical protein